MSAREPLSGPEIYGVAAIHSLTLLVATGTLRPSAVWTYLIGTDAMILLVAGLGHCSSQGSQSTSAAYPELLMSCGWRVHVYGAATWYDNAPRRAH